MEYVYAITLSEEEREYIIRALLMLGASGHEDRKNVFAIYQRMSDLWPLVQKKPASKPGT